MVNARVVYDASTKRFYLSSLGVVKETANATLFGTSSTSLFVAVSTTPNPTDPWRVLELPTYPHSNDRYARRRRRAGCGL